MGENGQRKEKGHAGLPYGRVGGKGKGYITCVYNKMRTVIATSGGEMLG